MSPLFRIFLYIVVGYLLLGAYASGTPFPIQAGFAFTGALLGLLVGLRWLRKEGRK